MNLKKVCLTSVFASLLCVSVPGYCVSNIQNINSQTIQQKKTSSELPQYNLSWKLLKNNEVIQGNRIIGYLSNNDTMLKSNSLSRNENAYIVPQQPATHEEEMIKSDITGYAMTIASQNNKVFWAINGRYEVKKHDIIKYHENGMLSFKDNKKVYLFTNHATNDKYSLEIQLKKLIIHAKAE